MPEIRSCDLAQLEAQIGEGGEIPPAIAGRSFALTDGSLAIVHAEKQLDFDADAAALSSSNRALAHAGGKSISVTTL